LFLHKPDGHWKKYWFVRPHPPPEERRRRREERRRRALA